MLSAHLTVGWCFATFLLGVLLSPKEPQTGLESREQAHAAGVIWDPAGDSLVFEVQPLTLWD